MVAVRAAAAVMEEAAVRAEDLVAALVAATAAEWAVATAVAMAAATAAVVMAARAVRSVAAERVLPQLLPGRTASRLLAVPSRQETT